MLGSNPGHLRLRHWLPDALIPRLDLIQDFLITGSNKHLNFIMICSWYNVRVYQNKILSRTPCSVQLHGWTRKRSNTSEYFFPNWDLSRIFFFIVERSSEAAMGDGGGGGVQRPLLEFLTIFGGLEPSRNRVVVPVHHATQPFGIGSLDRFLWAP